MTLYSLVKFVFQIPPPGKGSLYIRPLLMGSGAVLGLAPAPEYTFLIYVSPVGNYFKVMLICLSNTLKCLLIHSNMASLLCLNILFRCKL